MLNRWPTMVKHEFDFGFAVDWMRKDLGLALAEAGEHGASLPVSALIDQFYAEVRRSAAIARIPPRCASLRAVMRAAAAALALAQPHSYGLIDNVTGYTIDDQGHLRRFAGLLIDDTGKVDRLLNPGDKAPGPLSFRLDAHGKVLIPGLADATAMSSSSASGRCGSTSPAPARSRRCRQGLRPGRDRTARRNGSSVTAFDPATLGMARLPTAAEIDVAVADRPVWLFSLDGTAAVSIRRRSPSRDQRTTATRRWPDRARAWTKPRGGMIGSAMELVERAAPPPLPIGSAKRPWRQGAGSAAGNWPDQRHRHRHDGRRLDDLPPRRRSRPAAVARHGLLPPGRFAADIAGTGPDAMGCTTAGCEWSAFRSMTRLCSTVAGPGSAIPNCAI